MGLKTGKPGGWTELQVVGSGPARERDFGGEGLGVEGGASEALRQSGLKIRV